LNQSQGNKKDCGKIYLSEKRFDYFQVDSAISLAIINEEMKALTGNK